MYRNLFQTAVAVLALTLINGPVQATLLIDFDGDLIPDAGVAQRSQDINTASQRGFSFDDSASGRFFNSSYNQAEFSGGAVLGPGPDGLMATVFDVTLNTAENRWQANTNGRLANNDQTNSVVDTFLVFRKDQFLNGGDALTVSFDSNSVFNTDVSALGRVQRVAIKQGGQWYLSEGSTGNGQFELTDFNNNSANGKRWAAINPTATDFDVLEDTGSLTFNAVDFTDVQAVGLVAQANRGGSGNYVRLNDFSVTGTIVIPEPASIILLGLGSLMLLCQRNQK